MSIFTAAFDEDTCTAGTSGKKFGIVIDDADRERDRDDHVLPEGVSIHGAGGSGRERSRQRSRRASGPGAVRRGDRMRRADAGLPGEPHRALIVPLGSSCAIAPRCTVISVFGAISTVTYWSVSFEMRPRSAACGDDLVALLQRVEHRPRFLRLLLLRPDEQEVEDDEDRDHRQERHQVAAEGGRGRALRVRRGDQEVDQHVLLLRSGARARWAGPAAGLPGREGTADDSTTPAWTMRPHAHCVSLPPRGRQALRAAGRAYAPARGRGGMPGPGGESGRRRSPRAFRRRATGSSGGCGSC